jgi:MraZ protein
VFYGKFEHALDAKFRLAIPAKFRQLISKEKGRIKFYISPGHASCLHMYTATQWKKLEEIWSDANAPAEVVLERERTIYPLTQDGTFDSQGRVLLSEDLRNHAGITRDVIIAGTGDRIEIWDKKQYETYHASRKGKFDQTVIEFSKYIRPQPPSNPKATP